MRDEKVLSVSRDATCTLMRLSDRKGVPPCFQPLKSRADNVCGQLPISEAVQCLGLNAQGFSDRGYDTEFLH